MTQERKRLPSPILAVLGLLAAVPGAAGAEPELEGPSVIRAPQEWRLPLQDAQMQVIDGQRLDGGGCAFPYTLELSGGESRVRQELAYDPESCRVLVEEGTPDPLAMQAFAAPAAASTSEPDTVELPNTTLVLPETASCSGPNSAHGAEFGVQWVDGYNPTVYNVSKLLPTHPEGAAITTLYLDWTPTASCALSCPGSAGLNSTSAPGAYWTQDYKTQSRIVQGSWSCLSGFGISYRTVYRNGQDLSPLYNCAPRDITIPHLPLSIIGRPGLNGKATFTDTSYVSGAYAGCGQYMFKRSWARIDGQPILPTPP